MEDLKKKAKAQGLWNLFLSKKHYPKFGTDLTNVEYAVMAEIMGRGHQLCSESMNCSAPDTGNMEVLAKYGTEEQQKTWLVPLMNGEIRSAFAMTERYVASSDATNIATSIKQEGDEIVINGHKWWISGAGDPRCKVHLLMGKSHPEHSSAYAQQSMVIIPSNTPGVNVVRPMKVFGYDSAPEGHMEVIYTNVRVPLKNLLVGWGKGFEIIQGRLGPGRIHHCMRSIGAAETALEYMIRRSTNKTKTPFGKMIGEHDTTIANLAQCRIKIEQARLLVLSAARMIDLHGAKVARNQIAYAKVAVISAACDVVDRSMQVHGGAGISQEFPLASMYAGLRTLRWADGPDEVHEAQQGKVEVSKLLERG
jgi:acyl-CoA dehydrogenase